jgi:hypothetical protein
MAPHRLRLGRVRGPTMLGMLAAALLITALVVTGRWQDRAGRPPSPSAGPTAAADAPYRLDDGYGCPLGRPVLTMADGRSHPPGHPARPQAARAVGCYLTPEEAAAAREHIARCGQCASRVLLDRQLTAAARLGGAGARAAARQDHPEALTLTKG